MVYDVKIQGTRYTLELNKKYNEWFLELLIGTSVEEEYPVTDMSISGIRALTAIILEPISFLVNPLVVNRVTDELISKTKHILVDFSSSNTVKEERHSVPVERTESSALIEQRIDTEMINDISDSINMLFQTTQELTEKISQIEVKLTHIERITSNLAQITENLLSTE